MGRNGLPVGNPGRVSRKTRPTAPELVARLVEIGVEVFTSQLDVPTERAKAAMREVAHQLCREYGGQRMSVPQDMQYPLDQRDQELWDAYTGNNIPDLAARFALTDQQVRNIIGYVRQREAANRQVVLPGFEERVA